MEHADLIPVEIEDLVIGQVLYQAEAISRAARMVKPEHFAIARNRMVYTSALELWREGIGVDLVTVTTDLRKRGTLDMVGGAFQLSEWTRRVAQIIHLDYHCAIMLDYFGKRVLRQAGLNLAENTNIASENDELISGINYEISKAAVAEMSANVNAGERAYTMLNEIRPKPFHLGMAGVDDYVFMLPGNMVTVSAESGVGKTAFALSAVLNLAGVRKPWIVSLEMPADELLTRALCQLGEVDIADALNPDRLSDAAKSKLADASIKYHETLKRLDIDDTGNMTIDRFKALAEFKVKNEGVELIVVDYAQLMEADPKEYKGIAAQNEAISKGLRHVARSLNVILIVIVHVNKEGLSHGSAQYDKDAHVRLRLSREKGQPYMDVEIAKNRNGRTGSCRTPFEGMYGLVGRNSNQVKVPVYNPKAGFPNNRIESSKDETDPPPF